MFIFSIIYSYILVVNISVDLFCIAVASENEFVNSAAAAGVDVAQMNLKEEKVKVVYYHEKYIFSK